jgi:molecular chaperone GrpE
MAEKENSNDENKTNEETTDKKETITQKSAVDEKQLIIDDLTSTLKHLQAEFENYKKRSERENENYSKLANEKLIKELLPAVDNFELALKNAPEKDEFYKGMELIYSELMNALNNFGVECIDCECKFDPYYHEVLLTEESDKENNAILDELQKGYTLNGKVIRHAKVKIAKKKK